MKKIIISLTLIISVSAIGGFAVYKHFSDSKDSGGTGKDKPEASEAAERSESESDFIEPVDAEEYLNEIGEILKKYDVNSSEGVLSEEAILNMLSERGLDQYPVESNYSVDGGYYETEEISQDPSKKHPTYETYFMGSDESAWHIEIVNGSVYASPFSYNSQEDLKVPVILSETEYITSYDSATNQFFEIIPDSSEITIKVVPKINAELLESLTIEEINKL